MILPSLIRNILGLNQPVIVLLTLLLFSSCGKKEHEDFVEEFIIIGHSGCTIKDPVNWIRDSTKLDIREYFEYKKDSFIKVARRRPLKFREFFSINSKDTLGLKQLINGIILNRKFEKEYSWKETEKDNMYDGWYYFLYYKLKSKKEFVIEYVPRYLPDSLKLLHDFIVPIVQSDNHTIIERFEFNEISKKLAKEFIINHPAPPAPFNLPEFFIDELEKGNRN